MKSSLMEQVTAPEPHYLCLDAYFPHNVCVRVGAEKEINACECCSFQSRQLFPKTEKNKQFSQAASSASTDSTAIVCSCEASSL